MEDLSVFAESGMKDWAETAGLIDKLYLVAKPGVVFGEPAKSGEHTIITASEVRIAMGAGYGYGAGFGPAPEKEDAGDAAGASGGGGGGGGGGGVSLGRPVAVISVGPAGVRVEPVMDVTKVAIAFFTMLGSLIIMLRKLREAAAD